MLTGTFSLDKQEYGHGDRIYGSLCLAIIRYPNTKLTIDVMISSEEIVIVHKNHPQFKKLYNQLLQFPLPSCWFIQEKSKKRIQITKTNTQTLIYQGSIDAPLAGSHRIPFEYSLSSHPLTSSYTAKMKHIEYQCINKLTARHSSVSGEAFADIILKEKVFQYNQLRTHIKRKKKTMECFTQFQSRYSLFDCFSNDNCYLKTKVEFHATSPLQDKSSYSFVISLLHSDVAKCNMVCKSYLLQVSTVGVDCTIDEEHDRTEMLIPVKKETKKVLLNQTKLQLRTRIIEKYTLPFHINNSERGLPMSLKKTSFKNISHHILLTLEITNPSRRAFQEFSFPVTLCEKSSAEDMSPFDEYIEQRNSHFLSLYGSPSCASKPSPPRELSQSLTSMETTDTIPNTTDVTHAELSVNVAAALNSPKLLIHKRNAEVPVSCGRFSPSKHSAPSAPISSEASSATSSSNTSEKGDDEVAASSVTSFKSKTKSISSPSISSSCLSSLSSPTSHYDSSDED